MEKNMNTTFQRKGFLKVGGNVKVIRRTVGQFANAWGFGFDLGFGLGFGFASRTTHALTPDALEGS